MKLELKLEFKLESGRSKMMMVEVVPECHDENDRRYDNENQNLNWNSS